MYAKAQLGLHLVSHWETTRVRMTLALLGITPAAMIWLVLFAAPILIFIIYGFFRTGVLDIEYVFTFDAYLRAISSGLYLRVLGSTLLIAASTSICVCLFAFVFAYYATFHFRRSREGLLALIMISLFSGYLVRIYAWRTILGSQGILNDTIMRLGLSDHPLAFLLYSKFAVILVLVNILLPFAIIPLYSALGNVPREALEAARDLGAGPFTTIRTVVLPLAHRGVVTAFAFSFVLAAGDYVTPQLVGGVSSQMVGNVIADQFGASFDWPLASALGVLSTVSAAAVIYLVSLILRRIVR
jgi:spermidine/putrescine transport system permease protein